MKNNNQSGSNTVSNKDKPFQQMALTDETMLIPESVIKKPHIDNIMQTGIKQFREAKSSE